MNRSHGRLALATCGLALGFVAACGGGGTSSGTAPSPATFTKGASTDFAKSAILPGPNSVCPAGGTAIDYGIDKDGSGTLDTGEVTGTANVCNGLTTLVAVTEVLKTDTAACPLGQGGIEIQVGPDSNGNSALDPGEVIAAATQFVCNGGGGTDPVALAAALVAQAKPKLEFELVGGLPNGGAMAGVLDSVANFAAAAALDPTNQEALFYSSLGGLLSFVDGGATNSVLNNVNLLPFRYEAALCDGFDTSPNSTNPCPYTPFQPVGTVVVGGTDAYVNLSFAQSLGYASGSLPAALQSAYNNLAAIGDTFTTQFLDRAKGRKLTFGPTEVRMLQALTALEWAFTQLPDLYTYTDADAFLSDFSTRDPDTGQFITDDTKANFPFYFQSGVPTKDISPTPGTATPPLQANAAGIAGVQTALKSAFGSLSDGVGSLIANTHPGEIKLVDAVRYDAETGVKTLSAQLVKSMADDLSRSFDPGTLADTLTFYNAVGSIADFGSCDPLATADTNTSFNLNPFGQGGIGFNKATIDAAIPAGLTLNAGGGATPGTLLFSNYFFTLTIATPPAAGHGISIFSRSPGSDTGTWSPVWGATVAYANGSALVLVDSDNGSGQSGNFGISLTGEMFNGSILPAGPVTLYIQVGANSPNFTVYAWSDATAGVPIFLKGGGRHMQAQVYQQAGHMNGSAFIAWLGGLWDASDRSSLNLNADAPGGMSLQVPASYVATGATAIVPAVAGSVTWPNNDATNDPSNANWDPFTEKLEGDSALSNPTDVTGTLGLLGITVPAPFCAYPQDFSRNESYEGGLDLM